MNPRILHKDVQQFIQDNLKADLHKLILKGAPFEGLEMREIAEQIQSKSKCREKLPTWFESPGIYFPNKVSIEQSSSEITAAYKSTLFQGVTMADLTGGFGVDSYYFCRSFQKVYHCEMQDSLSAIVRHNAGVLKAPQMESIVGDGLQFALGHKGQLDLIYLDPARRAGDNSKVFLLKDCEPDIRPHLQELLQKSKRILVKLSPVLDIRSAIDDLKAVSEIRVVAVKNEVKELLFLLDKTSKENVKIIAANYQQGSWNEFCSLLPDAKTVEFSEPLRYLYEPNAAILKAGLFNEVAGQFKVKKLHRNSHLYTSEELIGFPGRRFEIVEELPYSPKKLKKQLKLEKANITTRNFQESVAQIRKRTSIKEGGDHYLFFTTDTHQRAIVLHCLKLD